MILCLNQYRHTDVYRSPEKPSLEIRHSYRRDKPAEFLVYETVRVTELHTESYCIFSAPTYEEAHQFFAS